MSDKRLSRFVISLDWKGEVIIILPHRKRRMIKKALSPFKKIFIIEEEEINKWPGWRRLPQRKAQPG